MPRIHHPLPLHTGQATELTPEGARHVQVLRMQPGQTLTLFGMPGIRGEMSATITRMGRQTVEVLVGEYADVQREPRAQIHLAVGMPANDRMDWLVEKATELGVASIQPLMTERTVLRLKDDRAQKKVAHWQSVAVAACEQCGGNQVPTVHEVLTLNAWAQSLNVTPDTHWGVLSLAGQSQPLSVAWPHFLNQAQSKACWVFGPEGGLSPTEDAGLRARGFAPMHLGERVLRTETAALSALTLGVALAAV